MRFRGPRRFPGRERRGRKDCRFFEAFVSEPEDVEAGFIPFEKLLGLEKIHVLFSSPHAKAGLLFCSTTGPSRIDIGLQGIDSEFARLLS